MIYLTKEQFKFLKKLSKIDKLSDIPKEINPIIRFLEKKQLRDCKIQGNSNF